jgi:hypothetical protein
MACRAALTKKLDSYSTEGKTQLNISIVSLVNNTFQKISRRLLPPFMKNA